jgi:hypothetical protein
MGQVCVCFNEESSGKEVEVVKNPEAAIPPPPRLVGQEVREVMEKERGKAKAETAPEQEGAGWGGHVPPNRWAQEEDYHEPVPHIPSVDRQVSDDVNVGPDEFHDPQLPPQQTGGLTNILGAPQKPGDS